MDRNRPDPVPNQPISDLDRLRVLVAHEFHHACQLRYTLPVNDDIWFMDNTSVLMEKIIYPQINFLKYRLADEISPLRSPQFAINKIEDYRYPGGLWPLFLNEFYNDIAATRKIWETTGENPTVRILPIINTTLVNNYESDLKEAVKQYAVWRYYTGSRADGSHFSDAANWFTSYVCTTHSSYPVPQTSQPESVGSPGGTSYLEFSHNSPSFIDLEFDGQDGWEWGAYTIRYYSSGQSIETDFPLDSNGHGTTIVPLAEYQDHVVLVPIMTDWQNPTSKRDYTYSANRSDLYEVEFMNRIGTANAGDALLLDGNDIILSGESRYFDDIELHMVETMKERFNQTEIYKHHDWNEIAGDYLLTDDFYTDIFIEYAQFVQLYPATIRNSLISAGGVHGGLFEFHDPWYVHSDSIQHDDFFPYSEILHPTGNFYESEGGVFLDQDYNIPGQPYYSVRAQQNHTINFHNQPIEWSFRGWEGDEADFEDATQTQTAVVFSDNDPLLEPEARARYKGHLASSSDLATAYNNGRQISIENGFPINTWHMVYEDDGQIYYTNSTDNGDNWEDEFRLSSSNSIGNSRPSIFVFQPDVGPIELGSRETSPVLLGVVWDRDAGHLDNHAVFRFMRRDLSWSDEIVEETFQYNCHPVLSGRIENDEKIFYVLCRHQIFQNIGLSLFRISESRQNFSRVQTTLQEYTSFGSINPSITVDRNLGGVDILHFCWEDENRIIYTYYFGGDIAEPQEISGPSWEGYNHHPSIAMDAQDHINVVWDQQGRTYPGTSFNHRFSEDGYEWEPIQRISSSYKFYTHPSVGAFENSPIGEMNSALIESGLYDEETFVKFLNYNGDGWQFQEGSFPGTSPGMSYLGADLMSVWTDHSMGLPYLIEDRYSQPTERLTSGNKENLQEDHYRTLLLDLADIPLLNLKGQVSLSLGEMKLVSSLGNQSFHFPHITDTTLLFTQTPSITVGKEIEQLRFKYKLWIRNFKKPVKFTQLPVMQIHLLEENKSTPLAVIGELLLNNITSDSLDIEEQISVDLKPYQGKSVNLRLQIIPNYFSGISKQITRIDVKELFSGGIEKQKIEPLTAGNITQLPDKFALHQNFPNPFNPVTTISFDLPQECTTSLQIFNTLGEHVATLVSKRLPAGTHQYTWNSGSLASGVYIYRLQAEGFVQTRKMILMK